MPDPWLPVSGLEQIVKDVIRAADAADRGKMWRGYLAFAKDAQQASEERMPWQKAEEVTRLSRAGAHAVLVQMIHLVDDTETAISLLAVAADSARPPRLGQDYT